MTKGRLRAAHLAWVFAAVLAGSPALAQDPGKRVEVWAEVVLVSNQGDEVDPPKLERMKQAFAQKGLVFTAFKRLSGKRLAVTQAEQSELSLPNGRTATLSLEGIKDGTAQLTLMVTGLTRTTYSLGREGSLYVNAGEHRKGQLVLVLSPAREGGGEDGAEGERHRASPPRGQIPPGG